MNDFYVKNISDRVKSVIAAKAKDGQKLSGTVPYGYERHPVENTRLIVDEYASTVVKRIFEARSQNKGYAAIAGILNKDGILPPRMYYFKRKSRETKAACTEMWTERTIKLMLCNELYIGHTISLKRKTRSYRDKRAVHCDESEWIRVENTHTPIINKDLWQAVQVINTGASNRYVNSRAPRQSLFSGIVLCADCNVKMAVDVSSAKLADGRVVKYTGYCCRTFSRSGRACCSSHRISERALSKLVLGRINEMAELITLDEDRILNGLSQRLLGNNKNERAERAKDRRELEQQLYALETQLEQLYEDKVSGVISSDIFSVIANKTETQRLEIEDRLSALTQTARVAQIKLDDIEKWAKMIKEKSVLINVDRDLLESLIDKIEIGEKSMVDGEKTQDVRINFKHVGLC